MRHSSLKGGSILKPLFLETLYYQRFLRISKISSQLLLIQYESEDLLPICYQSATKFPTVFLKSVLRWILQELEILLGGSLTVKN